MTSTLTKAQFAQQCSYIAKTAANWAGDTLATAARYTQPERQETVSRFTDRIRGKLDFLDEQAGRDGSSATLTNLVEVLKAYEAWEGCVVLNADWSDGIPKLTQPLFNRMLEIQQMRNAALDAVGLNNVRLAVASDEGSSHAPA